MSNDVTDGTPEQDPQGVPLQVLGLTGAVARALDEHHSKMVGPKKDAAKEALVGSFTREGRTGLVVEIDGEEVGRYTVNTGKDKYEISDPEAFLVYAEERDEVDYIVVPKKSFEKAVLDRARRDPATGDVFDSESGEILPGVSFKPGGKATGTVTWTWKKFQGEEIGRGVLLRAYQSGRLNELLRGVPELLPGAVQE
ncbi:hypothetical protein ACWDXD_25030 [Streptomyces sp. NPDC003314]